jgi:serine/threonine protein phosphatase PrpC
MSAGADAWFAGGASARGASHLRTGMANQDAIGWAGPKHGEARVSLVVSDGHGGKRHPLSDVGSRLAVDAALAECARLPDDPGKLEAAANGLLTRCHARWLAAVADHAALEAERPEVPLAYGATLVGVHMAGSRLLLFQIGDGDILVGRASGRIERPIPEDEGLTGEQTHSLCEPDAPRFGRIAFVEAGGDDPVDFVMASTDGVAKSFRDDATFLTLGSDFRDRIRNNGLAAIGDRLGGWLSDLSANGSGDDATLGIIARVPTVRAASPSPATSVADKPTRRGSFADLAFLAGVAVTVAAVMLNPWRPWQPWLAPAVLQPAEASGEVGTPDGPTPAIRIGETPPPAGPPAADAPAAPAAPEPASPPEPETPSETRPDPAAAPAAEPATTSTEPEAKP